MTGKKPSWRNAIVGYGDEAPDQLLANPLNAKIHPKSQQEALAAALGELGWLAPVIVSKNSGRVIDGHARIGQALSRGEPTVPVAYVELPPEQEALALATFDPLGSLAVTDADALDSLLAEITSGDEVLADFLDGQRQMAVRVGLVEDTDGARGKMSMGRLGTRTTSVVMIAVAVADLATVERALSATGAQGRGAALVQVATAYLETLETLETLEV